MSLRMNLSSWLATSVFLLGAVGDVSAAVRTWDDGGSDNLWSTAENWSDDTLPTFADKVRIGILPGPTIANEGAVADNVRVAAGSSTGALTVAGGTLTTSRWLMLGDQEGSSGTLNMNSGTIALGAQLFVGFKGSGTLNMGGGRINVKSSFNIPKEAEGTGHVNLHGGVIASKSFAMRAAAGSVGTMDITAGTLIIDGDNHRTVREYVDNGWITAYGGNGTVQLDYGATNNGKTTLKAVHQLNPNPPYGSSVNAGAAQLQWTLPDPNHTGGVVDCDVYFGTNPDAKANPKVVIRQAVEAASVVLAPVTIYYWVIDVYDSSKNTTKPIMRSPIFTFNTYNVSENDSNNLAEEDDIVCTVFYPWYKNPNTSGYWRHWNFQNSDEYQPPKTWKSPYIPNYPDSAWNPSVQLYDSSNTDVLRWQDRAMARAGIDIAAASWWGIGTHTDIALAKAIRICKNIKWCIYYEQEAPGRFDPSPREIYKDIKWVLDKNISSRNYAKIDGKWLVYVWQAGGEDVADRWRGAKAMLAADGYHIYLNGDKATASDPWDSIHYYSPARSWGFSSTPSSIDDSAWISPGFWKYGQSPRLERSLEEFTSAWNQIVSDKDKYRFIVVETWNEWHEGTQIEPGQEIVPDPAGYYPSGYDYGYDFIDAIGPTAVSELHWTSEGHRPIVPVRLEAEEMIWDNEQQIVEESPTECRIVEEEVRIGSSIFVPRSDDLTFTIRARSVITLPGRSIAWPLLVLYLDDVAVSALEVDSLTSQDYFAVVPLDKGIHKMEIGFIQQSGTRGHLIMDFVDINMPALTEETFETGDFSEFPWEHSGDGSWTVTSSQIHSGTHSAQAGTIDHDESTTLQVTLDCVSGNITFYRKVSSESGFDYLQFYIDGVKQDEWSGEQDWVQVSFPVIAGTRTFKWIYSKDGSSDGGSDTAWIDDIVFPVD